MSLIEILSIGLIGSYIALLTEEATFINNKTIKNLLFFLNINVNDTGLIIKMSFFLLIAFIIKTLFTITINAVIIKFSWKQNIKLRTRLISSYQSMTYLNYTMRNTAGYIQTMQTYTTQYVLSLLTIIRFIKEGIIAIFLITMLLFVNKLVFFLLLFISLIMILAYDKLFKNKLNEIGRQEDKYSVLTIKAIKESIEGFKEIRILGQEKYFADLIKYSTKNFAKHNTNSQIIQLAPKYLLELIIIIFIVGFVFINQNAGAILNNSLPILSIFAFSAFRLLPSVNLMITGLSLIRYYNFGVNQLYNDLNVKNHLLANKLSANNKNDLKSEKFQSLELINVHFSYPGTKIIALENINLSINAGDSIGIIGSSGAGKSTLVNLILGLFPPNEGRILHNSKSVETMSRAWAGQVAYLPQEIFLIDDSIIMNIGLGQTREEIDIARINKAIEQVQLSLFLKKLPDGINTNIGERGIKLSGGQRQRIALARAFYHNREIFVFDESTSALDHETEKEITAEIKRLKGIKTIIVIAHRLTTLSHCDIIYKIEQGKIVDCDNYDRIIKNYNG